MRGWARDGLGTGREGAEGVDVDYALIASPTLAVAQSSGAKKPLGKITCEDFLVLEESVKPKVVYWAVAYNKGGAPEAAVLDVEATKTVIPIVIEVCKKAPKESFWQKVKARSSNEGTR